MEPSQRVSHHQLIDLKDLLNKFLNDVIELDNINECHIEIDDVLNNPQNAVKVMSDRIHRSEEAFQKRASSVAKYMSSFSVVEKQMQNLKVVFLMLRLFSRVVRVELENC